MKQKTFLSILFLCLVAAAGIQAAIYTSGFYSISSDESARTLDAFRWYSNKTSFTQVWLPMHSVIIGCSLEISRDLVTTPRLVSLFFSLLSIAGLVLLTQQLFKNKFVTLSTSLLYTFLPERIILSAVPLAEIIFICFVIYGSAFLMIWISYKKSPGLLAAALFWAVSGTLRYEGWTFSASLLIFTFYEYSRRNLSLNYLLFISFLLISFPLYWILLSFVQNGNPFEFFSVTSNMFKAKFGDSFSRLIYFNVLWQFLEQNYNSYNIIGLMGLSYFFRKEKLSAWIIVCFSGLLLMGIISALGKALPSHNFWRTSAVWTILLIPFTSYLLYKLSHYFILIKPIKLKLSLIFALILLTQFIIISSLKIAKMNASYCLTEKDLNIGYSLNKILSAGVNSNTGRNRKVFVLIEKNRSFDHLDISLSTNLPECFLFFDKPGSKLPPSSPEIIIQHPYPDQIKKFNISYLLFKSEDNKKYLSGQKGIKVLCKYGDWVLYKVEKPHFNASL
ncbi:MAG: hypothetical protein ACM339_04600 [Ignavibacteria bacterium]